MVSLAFNVRSVKSAENKWWDSNWVYKRCIIITENSGHNLTNFSVKIAFEHDGHIQANGIDIRVIDNSTEVLIYIEECNSTHAKVVFEINLTALESKTVYFTMEIKMLHHLTIH